MTLDERVAVALGWHKLRSLWVRIPSGALSGPALNDAPRYSTDWVLVPEMLDWLEVDCYLKVALRRGADVCVHKDESMGICLAWQDGHSLPEALAKVVVCVAESRLRNYPSHTIEYKEEP